jgi:hypothetical protein
MWLGLGLGLKATIFQTGRDGGGGGNICKTSFNFKTKKNWPLFVSEVYEVPKTYVLSPPSKSSTIYTYILCPIYNLNRFQKNILVLLRIIP